MWLRTCVVPLYFLLCLQKKKRTEQEVESGDRDIDNPGYYRQHSPTSGGTSGDDGAIVCVSNNYSRVSCVVWNSSDRHIFASTLKIGRSNVQFDGFGQSYDQWWTPLFNFALTSSSAWSNPSCIPSFNLSSGVVSAQTYENQRVALKFEFKPKFLPRILKTRLLTINQY